MLKLHTKMPSPKPQGPKPILQIPHTKTQTTNPKPQTPNLHGYKLARLAAGAEESLEQILGMGGACQDPAQKEKAREKGGGEQ